MRSSSIFRVTLAFAALLLAARVGADDKDLLKKTSVPPNMMIIFGNSATTNAPLGGGYSMWDGDADSPSSKMGAAKAVIRQFVAAQAGQLNIGLSSFGHPSSGVAIQINRKHWLYSPTTVDYPGESFAEPTNTIERWGDYGEGPCTTATTPACISVSGAIAVSNGGGAAGAFFGPNPDAGSTAFVNIDATSRIQVFLKEGDYGDAYNGDPTLTTLVRGTYAMKVEKHYQKKVAGSWIDSQTPTGRPSVATVTYVPAASLKLAGLFFTKGDDIGKEVGFLNTNPNNGNFGSANSWDSQVNASCGGWEFQSNSAPLPMVKIPRDYAWGAAGACTIAGGCVCQPPQNSIPCVNRMLRPQGYLVRYTGRGQPYDTAYDHDNSGYHGLNNGTCAGPGCNDDLCDPSLRGAVNATLDLAPRQAILASTNYSQVPLGNLLKNIYDYFSNPAIDGFTVPRGKRIDDPDNSCRHSSVILIYDTFDGCGNTTCSFLRSQVVDLFASAKIPVYVIALAVGAPLDDNNPGYCIANYSGARIHAGTEQESVGYFKVTSPQELMDALNSITSLVTEASKDFSSASVSSVQAGGDQMAYLATFSASQSRSIWDGRMNAYLVNPDGSIPTRSVTIDDKNDPLYGAVIQVPSNAPTVLQWNAGMNLAATPGTGAVPGGAVLKPNDQLTTGSYLDQSAVPYESIPTYFYQGGRKIVWSLPQGWSGAPTELPINTGSRVPEARYDLVADPAKQYWPALKALLGPQTNPPAVLSPELPDPDATDSLRFIWGDRDAVMGAAASKAAQKYGNRKLGDIFHSNPALVGAPANYTYFVSDRHSADGNGYASYFKKYKHRRRVLFAGANDGLLHAFDVGAWNRKPSLCGTLSDGTKADCYDRGTGAELFAYAPRAIMQIYKPLKDAVGSQKKTDEWSVDGSPTAADVYIDPNHSGSPMSSNRKWQTVLVGGMREGSPFEGRGGASPFGSRGSYYALNITQPDEMETTGTPAVTTIAPGTLAAPKCLEASFDATCAASWPTVMWEITDTSDADASGTAGANFLDMGETWSRPAIGSIRICKASCTSSTPEYDEKYVAVFGGGFDRERLNRRGNWLYVVDIETGNVLMKANSSCGINAGSGCSPIYFGSMPSDGSAYDFNSDGYLDSIYIGDLKGQMWRVDLTDLRYTASYATAGKLANKIDYANGSAKPFLLFRAPFAGFGTSPANQFYPIYYKPTVIFLADNANGAPTVGVGFGTGDRDDIIASLDPISLTYPQRFYYIVDDHSNVTRTEADLVGFMFTSTAGNLTTTPTKGWGMTLGPGERLITDPLTIAGVISFGTYSPAIASSPTGFCTGARCGEPGGTSRLYQVLYANGNAVGDTRGSIVPNAQFITSSTVFQSGTNQIVSMYMTSSGQGKNPPNYVKPTTSIKEWKDR